MTEKELEDVVKKHYEDNPPPLFGLVPGTTGTYRLPGGGHTGIKGWEMFTKLLKEEAKKFIDDM